MPDTGSQPLVDSEEEGELVPAPEGLAVEVPREESSSSSPEALAEPAHHPNLEEDVNSRPDTKEVNVAVSEDPLLAAAGEPPAGVQAPRPQVCSRARFSLCALTYFLCRTSSGSVS